MTAALRFPGGDYKPRTPTAQELNAAAISWLDMAREDLAELEQRFGHSEVSRGIGSKLSRAVAMLVEQKARIDAEKAGLCGDVLKAHGSSELRAAADEALINELEESSNGET